MELPSHNNPRSDDRVKPAPKKNLGRKRLAKSSSNSDSSLKKRKRVAANQETTPKTSGDDLNLRSNDNFDRRKTPSDGIVADAGPMKDSEGDKLAQRKWKTKGKSVCKICDQKHDTAPDSCPLTHPSEVIVDSVIDFSSSAKESIGNTEVDKSNKSKNTNQSGQVDLSKSFAQLSLPSVLTLKDIDHNHGLSVLTKSVVKKNTQFGPLQGEPILERDIPEDFNMKDLWQVVTPDHKKLYLSTVNPEKSNWFRYLRPAMTKKSRNMAAVVKNDDQLYLVTLKDLKPGEEMFYWIDDPDLNWTKKRAEKKNCGGCNLKFSHPLYYRLHCTVFHDPKFSLTIRKYHCKVCGLAVLGKDNIVKHAQAEHDGKGAYQCQFCQKHFLRLNYLDMHRTYGCSANPNRTRPKCHLCGKKFCQPQKLKIHMRRIHNDKQSTPEPLNDLNCHLDSKTFPSHSTDQKHITDMATSDTSSSIGENSVGHPSSQHQQDASARVACEKCGRTFKNKSNLKIHMLTHSGVKPFGCKIKDCKSGFTTKQCLQFHYRKTHGLNEEEMPKIEREIPYTLSAYSGELLTERRNNKGASKNGKSTTNKQRSNKNSRNSTETSGSSNDQNSDDIYSFKDDEEDEEDKDNRVSKAQRDDEGKSNLKEGTDENQTRMTIENEADENIHEKEEHKEQQESQNENSNDNDETESKRASMLVEAALTAAENELSTKTNDDTNTESKEEVEKSSNEAAKSSDECNLPVSTSASPQTSLRHSAQSLIASDVTTTPASSMTDVPPSTTTSQRMMPHPHRYYQTDSNASSSAYASTGSFSTDQYGSLYPTTAGFDLSGRAGAQHTVSGYPTYYPTRPNAGESSSTTSSPSSATYMPGLEHENAFRSSLDTSSSFGYDVASRSSSSTSSHHPHHHPPPPPPPPPHHAPQYRPFSSHFAALQSSQHEAAAAAAAYHHHQHSQQHHNQNSHYYNPNYPSQPLSPLRPYPSHAPQAYPGASPASAGGRLPSLAPPSNPYHPYSGYF